MPTAVRIPRQERIKPGPGLLLMPAKKPENLNFPQPEEATTERSDQ